MPVAKGRAAAGALAILLLAGCSAATPAPSSAWAYPSQEPTATTVATARTVQVYRSPTCSCCHEWEAYLRADGWTVDSVETDDMAGVKSRNGLPEETWSCHTALIGGYVVEGHVPIEAIERLLAERPAIDGIALPGMPAGSPGMGGTPEPLDVLAVVDGTTTAFGTFGG